MSTPTDPTTPKPADAAGLLPCPFCEGREAIIHHDQVNDVHFVQCRCGASGPIVTASEIAAPAWNATRPLPTPHAAEAGVRDGDVVREEVTEMLAGWGLGTHHVDLLFELLARHRPAAETVGDGGRCPLCKVPLTDYGSYYFHPYSSDCSNGGKDMAKPATPPAVLEAAREALEGDTALVDWVEANAFKLTLHSGEAIYFDQRGTVQGFRAALNAVLPPAKGGAEDTSQ